MPKKKDPPKKEDAKKEPDKETQVEKGTEVAVDEKFIDQAVKDINEIANKTLYSGMMEIGQYVLEKFYDNDIEKASSKNPHKPDSYKKLCEREDLVLSLASLSMAVRVAGQEKFLEYEKVDTKKLTYTHKSELIKIDKNESKIKLAKKCIDENWSTRELAEEVKKAKDKDSSDKELPGRINIRYLESMAKQVGKYQLVSDSETLAKMQKKSRDQMKEKAEIALAKMQEKISECKNILDTIKEIEEVDEGQVEN